MDLNSDYFHYLSNYLSNFLLFHNYSNRSIFVSFRFYLPIIAKLFLLTILAFSLITFYNLGTPSTFSTTVAGSNIFPSFTTTSSFTSNSFICSIPFIIIFISHSLLLSNLFLSISYSVAFGASRSQQTGNFDHRNRLFNSCAGDLSMPGNGEFRYSSNAKYKSSHFLNNFLAICTVGSAIPLEQEYLGIESTN